MAASSNHSIFTVSRGHLAEGKNAPPKKLLTYEAFFFKKIGDDVVRGCDVEGRQRESLHIYSVPCDGPNRCIFTVWEGTGAHNPLQICSDPAPRDARRSKGRARNFFPFLGPPRVPAGARGKSFVSLRGRPRVLRRWTPARMTAYLQCPVRRPE